MRMVLLQLAVALGLLLSSTGLAQATHWTTTCVDCPPYIEEITDHALRVDAAGHPHVAYGGDHLYHAWYDGAAWHTEVVDPSPMVGRGAALDLDSDGWPHIAYYDDLGDNLMYAHQDASGWHIESIQASIGNSEPEIDLAVDWQGGVHVTFSGEIILYDDGLQYAYRGPSGWQAETVRLTELEVDSVSLALDTSGQPHIAFCLDGVNSVYYASRDGAGWHSFATSLGTGAVYSVSLGIDGQDRAHVAFVHQGLAYGLYDGKSWQFESVNSQSVDYPSLAVDANGRPWISYYDYTAQQLWMAHKVGAAWSSEAALPSDGSAYWHATSVALDAGGHPHAIEQGHPALRYGYYNGARWLESTIAESGWVGRYNSLALDNQGYPHISYRDEARDEAQLQYAYQDSTGWQIETVPTGKRVEPYLSLAIDRGGVAHLAYSDQDPETGRFRLNHASRDAGGWHVETVAEGVGVHAALLVDGDGVLHLVYGTCPSNCSVGYSYPLNYAHREQAGWVVESIPGATANSISLAVDSTGRPHMAYSNGTLYYGSLEAGGWTIDDTTLSAYGVTLAMDAGDVPYVGYHAGGQVGYLYRTVSGWQTEVIETDALYPAFGLDAAGVPQIAYIYSDDLNRVSSLKYARFNGGAWDYETVYTVSGWYDEYVSLAIAATGSPVITYFDWAGKDLKLVRGLQPNQAAYLPFVSRIQ